VVKKKDVSTLTADKAVASSKTVYLKRNFTVIVGVLYKMTGEDASLSIEIEMTE
jgi:hypothetical protein